MLGCRALAPVLVVMIVGCGGGSSDAIETPVSSSTSSNPVPSDSTTSSSLSTTTSLAADAAPAEMRGQWTATTAAGENVKLTLGKTSYSVAIVGLGGRSGRISVVGDEIVFSHGEECQGTGTYNWSIEDEELTFAIQGVDDCGRAAVLDGITYTLLVASP